jgi:hypothetical protein
MSYERTLLAIEKMASMVFHTEECVWESEEFGISLDSLIIGAYCFCADYHGGQWSPEYRALSALGKVFRPGSSSLNEEEEEVYYKRFKEGAYEHLEKDQRWCAP